MRKILRGIKKRIHSKGFISLVKVLFNKIEEFINSYLSIKKIRNLHSSTNLNNLVNFTYITNREIIKPRQVKTEFRDLLQILKEIKPETLLEIGTASGGTLFLFTRVMSNKSILISIDLPGGKHGGGYPKWKIPLYKSFSLPDQKLHLIRASSHKNQTLDSVKNILKNKLLDVLFIDGDHSYEGVKKDFKMYSPLVKNAGIIAFHDIKNNHFGVPLFWNEIKKNYHYKELIEKSNQKEWGLGLLTNKKI